MSRVRVVQQMSETECGPACLAMVLGAHGRATRVAELRSAFGTGRDGANARRILEVARQYGLQARGLRVTPEALPGVRTPAVVFWRDSHFVVLDRVDRRRIRIVDPDGGRISLTHSEFHEHFSGTVLEFEPTDRLERRRHALKDNRLLRFLGDVMRSARGWVLLALACSALVQVLGLGGALATKIGVDSIATSQGSLAMFAWAIGGYLGVQALVGIGRSLVLLILQQRLDGRLAQRFMTHLLRLPFRYFQTRSSGDLLMRLGSNQVVREMLTSRMVSLILDGFFVLVYSLVLLAINPLYAGIVLALGTLQVLVVIVTARPVHELALRELGTEAEAQSVAVDALHGVEFLKSSGLTRAASDRWVDLIGKYLRAAFRRRRMDTFNESAMGLVQAAAPMLLLVVGLHRVSVGDFTLGTMLAFNALAASLLAPVAGLAGSLRLLQTIGSHLDRIYDVLEEEAEPDRLDGLPAAGLSGAVEFRDVGFRYDGGPWILRNVSVSVPPGGKLAIVGGSGAGKTTLIRLLTGLLAPVEGSVLIDGRPIEAYESAGLRRRFGVVTQDPHVFGGSIEENLRLGNPEASDEVVLAAIARVQLGPDLKRLPMGLKTIVGESGGSLSGGQRQRLAIARALIAETTILVLDEATSHLDAITEAALSQELSRLGCTRVVVAHRMSTIMDADEILVLRDGVVAEKGTHDTLTELGGHYAELVRRQMPRRLLRDSV